MAEARRLVDSQKDAAALVDGLEGVRHQYHGRCSIVATALGGERWKVTLRIEGLSEWAVSSLLNKA